MSEIAIKVENLSKRYRIGLKEEIPETFVEAATNFITAPIRNFRQLRALSRFEDNGQRSNVKRSNVQHSNEDIIWALKDVSFEVERGEVVGIIGRNGAGKSTLLKILSRITHPTSGRVELNGRVSSLLEVGTGFHPELTGRENIYLNGTILGMTKAEVDRKFDEIVAFSGVEKFIDTPVKRYSSGMRVRLAFSVAAHLEPEILLVDEILAVGDLSFQKKCLGKMEHVSKSGRTVLFVSHNMAMIESLCPRAILLRQGHKAVDDSTQVVIDTYMENLRTDVSTSLSDRKDRQGTGEIRFTDVKILNSNGNAVDQIHSGQDCLISIRYESPADKSFSGVMFGASFYNRGAHLFSVSTQYNGRTYDCLPQNGKVICKIPRLPVSPGTYQFNLICRIRGGIADWVTEAGQLVVASGDFYGTGQLPPNSHPGVLVEQSWSVKPLV
jgi:lipopolysaccharide transport system ATP-binding protein